MKTTFLIIGLLCAAASVAAQDVSREATAAEVTAGTKGWPAVITPRRLAGGGATTNSAGDRIVLNGGLVVSNSFAVPRGATLYLNGNTVSNYVILTNGGVGIHLLSGAKVIGPGIITNVLMNTHPQASIGVGEQSGYAACTNGLIENVTCYGDTDAFYLNHSNRTTLTTIDCNFFSKWDAGINAGGGAHVVTNINTRFFSLGPSVQAPTQPARAFVIDAGSHTNHFINTTLIAVKDGGLATAILLNGTSCDATVYGGTIYRSGASGYAVDNGSGVLRMTAGVTDPGQIPNYYTLLHSRIAANAVQPELNTAFTIYNMDEFTPTTTTFNADGSATFPSSISSASLLVGSAGLTATATITAGGTTGAQTINKTAGTVNFAAGASSLVVTCDKVTTSSLVLAFVRANDTTATIKNIVPASGSFTIRLSAAATAETSVGFLVVNPQ